MKEYENSLNFWNQTFKNILDNETDYNFEAIEINPVSDFIMKQFAEGCTNVLDYGCGDGVFLFQCVQQNKNIKGLGLDKAAYGIEYSNKVVEHAKLENLKFMIGDVNELRKFEAKSFDGIICSNVLDVIDPALVEDIVKEFKRILTDNGKVFIKLNPVLTPDLLAKTKMTEFAPGMFSLNDNLRVCNHGYEYWSELFGKYFYIKYYLEFPYNGATQLNRLFYLEKNEASNSEK